MMIIRIHLTLYQVSLSVVEHFDVLSCAPFVTVVEAREMIRRSYDNIPIMTPLIVV
jgi:hypothetical protein